MCGFLAEFSFDGQELISLQDFKALLELSKHRGPDSTGISFGDSYRLGFNRLSILDLTEHGDQPKRSPSGRYAVVFNGELYNYRDLSDTYSLKGLESTSDTEVLIHLLDLLGIVETIKQLNGMYAITIVDTQSGTIYMTRDFAGIKPLFYGLAKEGLVAASQFDQVFTHPWFKQNLKLRLDLVKEYFGFGYMQAPNTVYEHIFQVEPGTLVMYDIYGHRTIQKLVSFEKTVHERERLPSYASVLESVVERQLVSDVPVATFLSGGIDSPLISAYAKKKKKDIEAFTLKVDNPEVNESDIAEAYAQHLDLKQNVVAVNEENLLKSVEDHFSAYSEPFGDYSSIPTYVITREAKKKYTVMLSGDGGDELFFGYPRMLDILRKRAWFNLPFLLRKNLIRVTNRLGLTNTWAPYFREFDLFVTSKHMKLPNTLLENAFPGVAFSEEMKTLYTFDNKSRKGLLEELRFNEFYAHLQRVLVKVDRASMFHSLEVRVPFLDKESIEYAWSKSGDLKQPNDLKSKLKKLLANELPQEIINQQKMGFTVPLLEWLHHELKRDVMEVVINGPFYGSDSFDAEPLKQFVLDFYAGKHNNVWGVWHIYAWQKWAMHHVLKS